MYILLVCLLTAPHALLTAANEDVGWYGEYFIKGWGMIDFNRLSN